MVDPAVISFDKCRWHVFAYNNLPGTNGILCTAGLISLALTSLMMLTLLRLPSKGCSHVMILNLGAICWVRSLLSVFAHAVMPAFNGFTMESCAVIGYLHKLISAYQVEAVTLLSIERYVLAKYYKLGVQVKRRHYILFVLLCWLFAAFYSLTPLMGFGTYLGTWGGAATHEDMDSTGVPSGGCQTMLHQAIYVALQLMQSVKPFVLTWYMLYWTCKIENECYTEDTNHTEKVMTKSTLRVSLVSALCWMPTFICCMWTIFEPKLKCSSEGLPAKLAMYGSLGLEVAPTATVLAIIVTNEHIRSNMLKLITFNRHISKKTV